MTQRKISGFIFDFDGTIVLSEHVHMIAWEDLASAWNVQLPENFLEGTVGRSDRECVHMLASKWDHKYQPDEILRRKKEFYMKRSLSECHEVEGVVDLIQGLGSKNVPIALATNSSKMEVEPLLKKLGILNFFKSLWTSETVSKPKPDPEIYIKASSSLGLAPEECLVFEDSLAGIESARKAGCQLVTVETLFDSHVLGDALLSIKNYKETRLLELLSPILR